MTRYHPRDRHDPEKVAAARARSEAVERGKPPDPPPPPEYRLPPKYHPPESVNGPAFAALMVRRYGDNMFVQLDDGDWQLMRAATELDKQEWPDFAEHAAKLAGEANAAAGRTLDAGETASSGEAGPPECTSDLCWCTTPPRLGRNDRIAGRCGQCGWSLGIVAWLSGKCTRCAHKLAHCGVQQCCPTCGNTDPRLRGGPGIGFGCYDAWHDPAASPKDRQLAAALRGAEAAGCVCVEKYCYAVCRACQARSGDCLARPAYAQSTGHEWQPEPVVKLIYGPTENQSDLRASPPDAKPAMHGGMPQWPGVRVEQDPDNGNRWTLQFDPATPVEIDAEQQVGQGGGIPVEVVATGPEPPPERDWVVHERPTVGVVIATIVALVALGLALAALGVALAAVPVP